MKRNEKRRGVEEKNRGDTNFPKIVKVLRDRQFCIDYRPVIVLYFPVLEKRGRTLQNLSMNANNRG